MQLESERLERRQLESLSTAELVRHAIEEAKLLARAEVLHAKKELQEEIKAARTAGILLGAGAVLALVGLCALFIAAGLALPVAEWLGGPHSSQPHSSLRPWAWWPWRRAGW